MMFDENTLGELIRDLVDVARAVERSRTGELMVFTAQSRSAQREHLVEVLRRAVLRHWCEHPPDFGTAALLQYLAAFETVREGVAPLGTNDLASGLAGGNGMHLVVEVAHDLRSPLTAILFLSEALQMGQSGPVTEAQRHQLAIIYTAALGLISLASDLIELAQDGQQLAEDEPTVISLEQVLTSVSDVARPMAEEKGLLIRTVVEGPDERMGYPVALSRVLLNLTTNALKFTNEGYVEMAARPVGPAGVKFTVKDTGRGLDPETLKHLYQQFRRSSARKTTTFSGSGLGLTICRKLVDAMGSQLKVESAPGEGSCFWFELDLPIVGNAAD
jgi:light-regulated signal transduction histidine kinase (bacteriophytochrome)